MVDAVEVDLVALSQAVSAQTGVTHVVRSLMPASTGYANNSWLADVEPQGLVFKVAGEVPYVFGRTSDYEPNVLAALADTQVPVPTVVARDDTGRIFGEPWFATRMVDGVSPPDDQLGGYASGGWFVDADSATRENIWNEFIDHLARLHSLPADALGDKARGGSHTRMLDFWTDSLADVMTAGQAPVQEAALAFLKTKAPADADADPRPCMGDSRLANVIVRDGHVVALLDWELAHVGNPRGDVAYHLYLDERYARVTGRRLEGLPDQAETWERWESRTGTVASDRLYWELYGATFMAITATRAMRLVHGFDPADIEVLNPIVADLTALLAELVVE